MTFVLSDYRLPLFNLIDWVKMNLKNAKMIAFGLI